MMIRMVGGWMFLLVPAHMGSPGQRAVKQLSLLCCCKRISWTNISKKTRMCLKEIHLLPLFHLKWLLLWQACQCTEMDNLIPLQYGATKLVLVGDPEQLPPTVLSKVLHLHFCCWIISWPLVYGAVSCRCISALVTDVPAECKRISESYCKNWLTALIQFSFKQPFFWNYSRLAAIPHMKTFWG